MRGRTNIGSGGISINADIETKAIASGDIIAGDFVEYYTANPYILQTEYVDFLFNLSGYAIALINNVLTAFKNGVQVDSYIDYNCTYNCKYNDFIIFHDNTAGVLGVLKIVNDEFVLVDTLQASTSCHIIGAGDGKVCYCYRDTSGGSYNYKIYHCVVNISSAGILSDYVETIDTTNTDALNFKHVYYYNNYFYYYIGTYWTKIQIDSSNNVTIISRTNILSGSGVTTNVREIYFKNGVVIFAFYFAGSNDSQHTGRICILDVESANYIIKDVPDHGEIYSYVYDGKLIASGSIWVSDWPNSRYQWVANSLRLYDFNENTYELTLIDEIVLPDNYSESVYGEWYNYFKSRVANSSGTVSTNLCGIDDSVIYGQVKYRKRIIRVSSSSTRTETDDDLKIYLYEALGGTHLQPLSDTDYVIPYQDGGNVIGVAKNGGTTGDTIDVYVSEEAHAESIKQIKSATPYTIAQSIIPDSGRYLSRVNVAAISYVEESNSAGGKTVTIGMVAPVPT